jgi:predicted secreted protein
MQRKNFVNKFLLVIFVIVIPIGLLAQVTFRRTFGGSNEDEAFWIEQLSDNSYIVSGSTKSYGAGGKDAWIFKLNEQGNMQWQKTYGGSLDENSCIIKKTFDGGLVIITDTKSFGAGEGDIWILKTNSSGDTMWSRFYGGPQYERAGYIYQTADSGYIFSGTTKSIGAGDKDFMLVKIDALTNTQWIKTFGGSDSDIGRGFCPTPDSGYLFIGSTWSFGAGGSDIWAIKTNANGDTQWTRTYGGTQPDEGLGAIPTRDGGYAISGMTSSYGAGSYDLYIIKITSTGVVQWTKTYGTPFIEIGCFGDTLPDGGSIASGTVGYTGITGKFWLLRLNSVGDTLWTKKFGSSGINLGASCLRTADNGFIQVGRTWSFATSYDAWIIKTDQYGNTGVSEENLINNLFNNSLTHIFPNPFISRTKIYYALNSNSNVKLSVFDVNGCLIKSLVDKHQNQGSYSVIWDGKNNDGALVNNGIYFYRLQTNNGISEIRKMLFFK